MPFSPQGQISVSQNKQFTILRKLMTFIFAIRERVNRGFLHRFSMYNCTATKEVQPFKNNLKSRFIYIYPSFLSSHFSLLLFNNKGRQQDLIRCIWYPVGTRMKLDALNFYQSKIFDVQCVN